METRTTKAAEAAAYMREHRAAWRAAGFATMSSMVHEDDKPKLSAYSDLTKFEKLLSLVNADDDEAIDLAATRNTPKLPTFDMVEEVRDLADKLSKVGKSKGNADMAQSLMRSVRNYGEKHRTHLAASKADEMDDKSRALAVIYGNLAVATYRLANAIVRYSPHLGDSND